MDKHKLATVLFYNSQGEILIWEKPEFKTHGKRHSKRTTFDEALKMDFSTGDKEVLDCLKKQD